MATDETKSKTSFRLSTNEEQIDDHEKRITRLERGSLIVVGYLIAEGSNLIESVFQLL